jgi:hypothetical protein
MLGVQMMQQRLKWKSFRFFSERLNKEALLLTGFKTCLLPK